MALALSGYLYVQQSTENLPPPVLQPKIQLSLSRSDQAWREGELVEAISIARELSKKPQGQLAGARLRHYSQVIQDYESLLATDPGPEYARQLTRFYLGLDPVGDPFFWQNLEQDYQRLATPKFIKLAQKFLQELREKYPDLVLDGPPE